MKEIELKPCPFCGNNDLVFLYRNGNENGCSVRIRCHNCFANGADFDETPGRYRAEEATQRAVEAWNKRG